MSYDCTQPIQVMNGLKVRPYHQSDVEALYPRLLAEKDDLFMIYSIDTMESIEDLHKEIDRVNYALKEGERLGGAVELGGRIVGSCRISGVKTGDTGDLGYWLFKEARGQGIITKCSQSLMDIAFSALDLQTVTVCAAVSNHRSCAVPERLGFKLDQIKEKCLLRSGKWWDGAIYVMTCSRWAELSEKSARHPDTA